MLTSQIREHSEIVRDLKLDVLAIMHSYDGYNKGVAWIVAKVLSDNKLYSTEVIRREYDGNSEAGWLIEKMIGEFLIYRKVNQ